ncbi:hypothetical protein Droror1_Dr00014059 [Drosera rotundifolia]
MAPALFVFGDSLVDVGNNNYLFFSLFKVDFPHYDIDYPDQERTGRYSNGKNSADFIGKFTQQNPDSGDLMENGAGRAQLGAQFVGGEWGGTVV